MSSRMNDKELEKSFKEFLTRWTNCERSKNQLDDIQETIIKLMENKGLFGKGAFTIDIDGDEYVVVSKTTYSGRPFGFTIEKMME
jgi:hypothetical protein